MLLRNLIIDVQESKEACEVESTNEISENDILILWAISPIMRSDIGILLEQYRNIGSGYLSEDRISKI
jgi:hypothetical protein